MLQKLILLKYSRFTTIKCLHSQHQNIAPNTDCGNKRWTRVCVCVCVRGLFQNAFWRWPWGGVHSTHGLIPLACMTELDLLVSVYTNVVCVHWMHTPPPPHSVLGQLVLAIQTVAMQYHSEKALLVSPRKQHDWHDLGTARYSIYQMLSWWKKKSLYSINIQDTVTNVVPLCSVHQAPSYAPNFTFVAPFPTELVYLSMLFIFEVVCTACSTDHVKKK